MNGLTTTDASAGTRRDPSVLSLIGNTPLVEVTRLDRGRCRLFVKLESQNPGGSIKDRIALSMIAAAEQDGRLKPGGTVVEATAGNTGLGLALVARAKGYRVLLVIPDKMSAEKVLHLKAHGGAPRRGNPRGVLRESVRQPGQSAGARAHHRPRDLETNGARRRRCRLRDWIGRYAHWPEPLLCAREPGHADRARRSGGFSARALR